MLLYLYQKPPDAAATPQAADGRFYFFRLVFYRIG